jgi:hypothetical protein
MINTELIAYLKENKEVVVYKRQLPMVITSLILSGINWFDTDIYTTSPDYYGETEFAKITMKGHN